MSESKESEPVVEVRIGLVSCIIDDNCELTKLTCALLLYVHADDKGSA